MTVHATPENKKRWERCARERAKFNAFTAHYDELIGQREDLLEALEGIMRDLPSNKDWLDPALEAQARAAVARAKGETA